MRDQLIGYVEGTLTPRERAYVMKRIESSPHWQQELSNIEKVQHQLQFEMPLLGRPQDGQLDSLLPDILDRAMWAKKSSRWQPPTGGLQTLFVICTVFVVLMAVPFLLHDPAANASSSFTQEVPLATNTAASVYKKDTVEARYTTNNLDATEEPANQSVQEFDGRGDYRHLALSASPVPAPGGTAVPSLEPHR